MGYTYRTSGPWGPGLGSDLSPAQVDNNFWQAVQDIAAKAAQGVGISNFVVEGNQMTVVLTDHTLLGPYPLPMMQLTFRGEWQAATDYNAGNIITHSGSTYMVQVNHTSAATFDPYANDGAGTDFYGLLLQNPAGVLPAGGPAGWFLRKATSGDYVVHWATASLEDLSDIVVTSPVVGQVLIYESGGWHNAAMPEGTLNGLSDVSIANSPAPTNGQLLTYESGTWTNHGPPALSTLSDVAVASPAAGQPLVWNGTAWADVSTVDMPCGGQISVSGSITVDRSQGEVHRLLLAGTTTLTTIVGWPPGGQFARLVLEIQNNGGYGFAFPSGTKWPSGVVPTVTPAAGGVTGKDVFVLLSFDGGATVYGNIAGQNFR